MDIQLHPYRNLSPVTRAVFLPFPESTVGTDTVIANTALNNT